MNKIIALTIAAFGLIITQADAQKPFVEKGDITIGVGAGIFSTFVADRGTTNVLPLSLNLGYRIADNFSVNAFGGYTAATSRTEVLADGIPVQYRNDQVVVGLRGEVHTNHFDRVDLYGGLMIGYYIPMVTTITNGVNTQGEPVYTNGPSTTAPFKFKEPTAKVIYSGTVGALYHLNERFGAFAEVGYGVALLSAGLNVKL